MLSPAHNRVVFSRLIPWGQRAHGGVLRSRQIAELVCRSFSGAQECLAPDIRATSPAARARLLWEIGGRLPTVFGQRLDVRDAAYMGLISRLFADHDLKRGDVVVVDADRSSGRGLMAAATARGLSVVALPQNFEGLMPAEWPPRFDLDAMLAMMRRDVNWLSRTAQVWAIGALDQELLQLFGIPACLLPYWPPAQRCQELLALRQLRATSAREHVLVLGSATNPPTRTGMLELLKFLRQRPVGLPVVVAGYGTDQLAAELSPGVRVVGEQSDEQLRTLLARAHLLWVHQGPMTGALTRVTEALIAGIPILGNHWAARSVPANPGLRVYADLEEAAALVGDRLTVPTVPDISREEQAFVAALRQLQNGALS